MKFSKNIINQFTLGIAVASLLSSCNTRYLKDGEILYTGAKINIINDTLSKKYKNELKEGLEANLTPKPNSSFLGLRPRLWIYNITPEPKKEKGIINWLKNKVGEKPVLLQQVDKEFNKEILVNHSQNKGYFNNKVNYDTISNGKKARVEYDVKTGARYYISQVNFPEDSTKVNAEIRLVKEQSLLRKGKPFDLDIIKAERERIDNRMKEHGFYYFHQDNIIVQADSTVSKKPEVELFVKLKDNTPAIAKKQFSIDRVIVFPDYNLANVSETKNRVPSNLDSAKVYKNFLIVDPKNKFNPRIFDRALYFQQGEVYNRADHNLTLNRLISLGVFKFVKNQFVVSDSLKNKLDAYYLLTPREFQSLRVEFLAKTNSANYGGSEVNVNWMHRNLFRGAEQLKITAFSGFDLQMGGPSGRERNEGNLFRFGGNAQLSFPRIVAPFRFISSSEFVPRTNVTLGYEYVNRTKWYELHNFHTSFGYNWKESIRKEHDLKLMDATLVYPRSVTPEYEQYIQNFPYLKRAVEQQFIFGPTYSFTYTNTMLPKSSTVYYRGFLDLVGNLTGLITGANIKEGKEKTLFSVPFSQYAKMEHDFRFYHKMTENQSIATRVIAGLAYPYGNSMEIPFARQFFAGGSNSIRAFRARTLGPGSYDPRKLENGRQFVFDQAGDVKLELNAEYRAKLYKFLNAAVFADAGNVWLINEDATRSGARFSKDWLSEIAVGAGVGLRLDFNILLFRLDLAMPLRVPYYEKNDRWMFNKINLGSGVWRRDNLMLNIAIGYPF